MSRSILPIAISLLMTSSSLAQISGSPEGGNLIKVYGKVLSNKDSSGVNATIIYEKLPYYDDIGMAKSKLDGSYEFNLLEGTQYMIRIDNLPNYEPYQQEFSIEDTDGGNTEHKDIYIVRVEDEELITLSDLNFGSGSAVIRPNSFPALNKFIEYVNERPDVLIQLEGHTDFAGNDDANMRLSEARVEAVADYITSNGVKKSRVSTKAFGGTQPLTRDRSPEGRASNRRVEVRLIRQNRP